jgi:hypothetical protein
MWKKSAPQTRGSIRAKFGIEHNGRASSGNTAISWANSIVKQDQLFHLYKKYRKKR